MPQTSDNRSGTRALLWILAFIVTTVGALVLDYGLIASGCIGAILIGIALNSKYRPQGRNRLQLVPAAIGCELALAPLAFFAAAVAVGAGAPTTRQSPDPGQDYGFLVGLGGPPLLIIGLALAIPAIKELKSNEP